MCFLGSTHGPSKGCWKQDQILLSDTWLSAEIGPLNKYCLHNNQFNMQGVCFDNLTVKQLKRDKRKKMLLNFNIREHDCILY